MIVFVSHRRALHGRRLWRRDCRHNSPRNCQHWRQTRGTVERNVPGKNMPENFSLSPITEQRIFQATGGPYGSITVDEAFEQLLMNIFGRDFMTQFRCVAWSITCVQVLFTIYQQVETALWLHWPHDRLRVQEKKCQPKQDEFSQCGSTLLLHRLLQTEQWPWCKCEYYVTFIYPKSADWTSC